MAQHFFWMLGCSAHVHIMWTLYEFTLEASFRIEVASILFSFEIHSQLPIQCQRWPGLSKVPKKVMNSIFIHFLEDGTKLKILSEIARSSEPGGPVLGILVHPISTKGHTMPPTKLPPPPPPDFQTSKALNCV